MAGCFRVSPEDFHSKKVPIIFPKEMIETDQIIYSGEHRKSEVIRQAQEQEKLNR